MSEKIAIAMNRFGLGARGDAAVPANPQSWLLDQLGRYDPKPTAISALPGRAEIVADFQNYRMMRKEAKDVRAERQADMADTQGSADPAMMQQNSEDAMADGKVSGQGKKAANGDTPEQAMNRKIMRGHYVGSINARITMALSSQSDFAERLVHFWANHFAVSANQQRVTPFVGNHEFDAIRPNIMGRFSTLLRAASLHPAMLLYLDQAQSIGPASRFAQNAAAKRNKEFGLNENLAREILELHTLGVRSVYTQADVTEFAHALTGVTVTGMGPGPVQRLMRDQNVAAGETVFFEPFHQPGKRTIIGKTYADSGRTQAEMILDDLAVHPATAKHVATKLAQHFVADMPPASLVKKLEANFLKTGGDLPSLYRTLIEAPEAWTSRAAKFKTPWEWTLSSLRALNITEMPGKNPQAAMGLFEQMGQPVWKPGSPKGYPDTAKDWAGPAALMRRVETAQRFARLTANRVDARALGSKILPGSLSADSLQHISRAESPEQGLALLLVTPEFLRR